MNPGEDIPGKLKRIGDACTNQLDEIKKLNEDVPFLTRALKDVQSVESALSLMPANTEINYSNDFINSLDHAENLINDLPKIYIKEAKLTSSSVSASMNTAVTYFTGDVELVSLSQKLMHCIEIARLHP